MKTHSFRNTGARAATLVEVIVSIALITISCAALLAALGYGFKLTKSLRENQRATQIMLEIAETLRLYSWDQVNSNGFIPSTFVAHYDPQDPTNPGISYHANVTVASHPSAANYGTNMRVVTIVLNWTNGTMPQSRTLLTAISKDGLQNYVW